MSEFQVTWGCGRIIMPAWHNGMVNSPSRCNTNIECLFTMKSHIESQANPSVNDLYKTKSFIIHKWWWVLNLVNGILKSGNFIKISARISYVMLWGFLSNHVNGNFWTTQIENIDTLAYHANPNFRETKTGQNKNSLVCVCECVLLLGIFVIYFSYEWNIQCYSESYTVTNTLC